MSAEEQQSVKQMLLQVLDCWMIYHHFLRKKKKKQTKYSRKRFYITYIPATD